MPRIDQERILKAISNPELAKLHKQSDYRSPEFKPAPTHDILEYVRNYNAKLRELGLIDKDKDNKD